TGSEVEALHLEQNLVKRHRPPFNVRLRDDKSFPYIAVTVEDEYPRVMFTRERHRAGVWYFGPYANAKKVRETLDVLNRVFRYRLFAVQRLGERQAVERQSVGTVDVIGFAAEGDRAVVQIFPLRGGKMVDRHSFHLENVGGQDVTTILESFGLEYYGSAPSVPPQIVVPSDAGDLSALAELLSERRGAGVEIRKAESGEKRRLQRLADEDVLHVLPSELADRA